MDSEHAQLFQSGIGKWNSDLCEKWRSLKKRKRQLVCLMSALSALMLLYHFLHTTTVLFTIVGLRDGVDRGKPKTNTSCEAHQYFLYP
jgi:hypothetical protein